MANITQVDKEIRKRLFTLKDKFDSRIYALDAPTNVKAPYLVYELEESGYDVTQSGQNSFGQFDLDVTFVVNSTNELHLMGDMIVNTLIRHQGPFISRVTLATGALFRTNPSERKQLGKILSFNLTS